jgi:two-component system chemotaxis response regulator CheB
MKHFGTGGALMGKFSTAGRGQSGQAMAHPDIVVIGASAGGVEALQQLVSTLPAALPASVLVVVHVPAWSKNNLAAVLARAGTMPVQQATNGEEIQRGRVYVARADHHLLIEEDRTLVVRGPKENRFRPAVDPLFRSAAIGYGPRAIGVLLSGSLDDGTAGLWQIKRRGGLAVVQDPRDAQFPGMVASALANVEVDHVVPLKEMAALLEKLVNTPAPAADRERVSKDMSIEQRIAKMEDNAEDIHELGDPSAYVCPECQGTLFRIRDGKPERYRCRTGHAYSARTLIAEDASATEDALWAGMRALREHADLLKQQAEEQAEGSTDRERLLKLAEQAKRQAKQIREMIRDNGRGTEALKEGSKGGAGLAEG